MKTLAMAFKKDGFNYGQVFRKGNVAIYRQTKEGQRWEAFEVGLIRHNPAREMFGVPMEASESWPRGEEWGIRAFTCRSLGRAKERAATLTPPNSANR